MYLIYIGAGSDCFTSSTTTT